jgi:hypothetical protein
MKKFLLAALTWCLFLSVFVSPAMALGQQQTLIVPNTPLTLPQPSSGCQALQDRLAQIRHLLQFTRVSPGDDTQTIMIRNAARANLLKQMAQEQLDECSSATMISHCQVLQDQLAQVSHLLQLSRAYPGDGMYDPQVVKTRMSARAALLKQLSQVQTKLNACLSSSIATA